MTVATFAQVTFRIRDDDGDETGATWLANQGDDYSMDVDTKFRVRFRCDETTGTKSWSNNTFNLYYQLQGGGYFPIDNTTPVKYTTTGGGPYYADGDDCTAQLTGGSGAFVTDNNGMASGDASVTNSGAAGELFECEFCLTIDSAQVSNGNTINLRVYNGAAAFGSGYTDTPVITVVEAVGPITGTLDKTLGALTADATAEVDVVGTLDKALGSLTCAGTGTVGAAGGVVVEIDNEDGGFADYDGTVNSTDLAVNGTAAMVGSYGLEVTVDGSQALTYGYVALSSTPTTYRYRYYFNTNSISMNDTDVFAAGAVIRATGAPGQDFITGANIQYNVDHYELFVRGFNDSGGASDTDDRTISDGEHCIEVMVTRATDSGSSDGTLTVWIDDDNTGTNPTNIDNYDQWGFINQLWVGTTYLPDATVTGSVYIDDVIVRNDGTEIGPAEQGATGTLSKTLGTLTMTGAGEVDVEGALDKTLGELTSDATAEVDINAALDKTLGTLTAEGIAEVDISAALDKTLGELTCDATASSVVIREGALDVILGALTCDATGQAHVSGALDKTLGELTCDATGEVDIAGAVNVTLGAVTSDATAKVYITGALDKTLGELTCEATGNAISGIQGTLDKTLGALTAAGTGQVDIAAVLDKTLGGLTADAQGNVLVQAALDKTLGALTAEAQGSIKVSGALDKTLGTLTCSGAGRVYTSVNGALDVTLGALILVATATVTAAAGHSRRGIVYADNRETYEAEDDVIYADNRISYKA